MMTAPKKPRRKKPAEPTAAAPIEPEALTARVRLEIPIAAAPQGHASRRLDCSLSSRERAALRLLFDGLLLEGEIVRGRPINRCQDAVRWLLGNLADELDL